MARIGDVESPRAVIICFCTICDASEDRGIMRPGFIFHHVEDDTLRAAPLKLTSLAALGREITARPMLLTILRMGFTRYTST